MAPSAACRALADWERNSTGGGSIGSATALQNVFAATDNLLSGDFATWVSDARTGSSDAGRAGGKVGTDCSAYGVTVFPGTASSSPSASAAKSPAKAPGATVSERQALASAESYLSDGSGFSMQAHRPA